MKRYPLYIFDLDGTLYRGNQPIEGAVASLQTLQSKGAIVRYFTNNSSQRRDQFAEKLVAMGFFAEEKQILTSASVTSQYLQGRVRKVHVVGEEGIRHELGQLGIQVVEGGPCDAVVCGIDRSFTYQKMNLALQQLLDPKVILIATNGDLTYPVENGGLIPGAGAILASIETCSGKKAFVCGKPNPLGIQQVLEETGLTARDCLVVGDRFETDIQAGTNAGCDVHLVLSGVTSEPRGGISTSQNVSWLV